MENPGSGSATLIKTTKDEGERKSETDLDEVVLPVEDVDEAEDEDGGHVEGQRDQEHEEVPVVPSPCQKKLAFQQLNNNISYWYPITQVFSAPFIIFIFEEKNDILCFMYMSFAAAVPILYSAFCILYCML
jgi:hypothetical protein